MIEKSTRVTGCRESRGCRGCKVFTECTIFRWCAIFTRFSGCRVCRGCAALTECMRLRALKIFGHLGIYGVYAIDGMLMICIINARPNMIPSAEKF
jgi:hypothetical protein